MSVTLSDIALLIDADIPNDAGSIEIEGLASLESAGPRELSFLSNPRYARFFSTTEAAAVIVSKKTDVPDSLVLLVVDDPYVAFLKVLELFNTRSSHDIARDIDQEARIHEDAVIGDNVSIGPFAVIGRGASIGDGTIIGPCTVIMKNSKVGMGCILYPNVTIMDGCEIGDRVILHAGVVIGSDGFGFAPHGGRLQKIPQIGTVRIGDDVEIQACTCVDRAAFGVTLIESGTKIDNLVQIGHNVRIGRSTVIASQTGISGSTTIGSGVRIGGQAGFAGHITIEDGASVGAQAGVTKDVPGKETVSGYPARRHAEELRLEASLTKVPDLIKKVKNQEQRIADLERYVRQLLDHNSD